MELVVAIGVGGKNIAVADVEACVGDAALDTTRRDIQNEAKHRPPLT